MVTKVTGSSALTPNRRLRRSGVVAKAQARPMLIPKPARISPCQHQPENIMPSGAEGYANAHLVRAPPHHVRKDTGDATDRHGQVPLLDLSDLFEPNNQYWPTCAAGPPC